MSLSIIFAVITVISAIFSTSTFFALLGMISSFAILAIGAGLETLTKIGKCEWATETERFADGSSLKTVKFNIIGVWGVCLIVCILCVFVIILQYQSPN
ncbi:MAG: hypothetical protein LBJ20_02690 [Candidatus Methanoplasma sp.]|nr:hypothetical protein [Candidatus Methanoplasma sp.]